MSEEAGNMNRLIAFFKLDGAQGTRHYASSPASNQATSVSSPSIETYRSPSPVSEPVMTYKSDKSNTNSDGGAASFSENDEWEDF